MSKYNAKVVCALMEQTYKIPKPKLEYQFCPGRKWAFDFAWQFWGHWNGKGYNLSLKPYDSCSKQTWIALEVQGGVFTQGRHTRGGALLKEWEKLNMAAILGWRILYCQPDDIYKKATMEMIQRALGI